MRTDTRPFAGMSIDNGSAAGQEHPLLSGRASVTIRAAPAPPAGGTVGSVVMVPHRSATSSAAIASPPSRPMSVAMSPAWTSGRPVTSAMS